MNTYFNTFLFLCRSLSRSADPPSAIRFTNWLAEDDRHWLALIDVANDCLMTPALGSALGTKEETHNTLRPFYDYLSQLHKQNLNRNRNLRDQTLDIIELFNKSDIQPMLIKGVSHLLEPIHRDMGCRIMTDLDILVPESQIEHAFDVLLRNGYRKTPINYNAKGLHHHPPVYKPGRFGKVELHRQALHHVSNALLPTGRIWDNARPIEDGGRRYYLPDPTDALLISLIHSQIDDRYHCLRQFNLRALYDWQSMIAAFGHRINWSRIKRILDHPSTRNVLAAHAVAAKKLLNCSIPNGIQSGLTAYLHYHQSMMSVRWKWVERLCWRADDFSQYRICKRYGCKPRAVVLAAYRMKYLLAYVGQHLSEKTV